jgi:cytochrome c-type biogenesis protein CcmH/NrfG
MTSQSPDSTTKWQPKLVYEMATVCLLLGLGVGYLLRGSESPSAAAGTRGASSSSPAQNAMGQMPTLEQMKQMADKKAEPLLQQLKKDPKNKDLLLRVAYFYKSAHQFKEAAQYLEQALQLDPRNVAARTERASCLYYDNDIDGALAELQESLRISPSDANSLFNLGMIRLNGKQDSAGAIAAWQELLKTNPKLEKKSIVEQMIVEARQQKSSAIPSGMTGTPKE